MNLNLPGHVAQQVKQEQAIREMQLGIAVSVLGQLVALEYHDETLRHTFDMEELSARLERASQVALLSAKMMMLSAGVIATRPNNGEAHERKAPPG